MMKKQILLGLLAAGMVAAALTACDSGAQTGSATAQSQTEEMKQQTAIAVAEEYIKENFPGQYVVEYMESKRIYAHTYAILNVMTNTEDPENQVTVEPTLAVRDIDHSLWAYYPDGEITPVEYDEYWKVPTGRVTDNQEALAIAQAYCNRNFPGKFLLELMPAGNEPHELAGDEYWPISVVTNVEKENQTAVEPALAVRVSDGTLWAYYPDDKLIAVEQDEIWKPQTSSAASEVSSAADAPSSQPSAETPSGQETGEASSVNPAQRPNRSF